MGNAKKPKDLTPEKMLLTRRNYLYAKSLAITGESATKIRRSVEAVEENHPEVNFDEQRTWEEWEAADD